MSEQIVFAATSLVAIAIVAFAMLRGWQGWLTLKRASPMPASAYFGAKVLISMMFGAMITLLLGSMGVFFAGVDLTVRQAALLFLTMMLGAAPFCAIGCALAYSVGPNSAPAITNLIYLPMSFASGLWIPIEGLPKFVQTIAPGLPPYHLNRLALRILGFDQSSAMQIRFDSLSYP